MKKLVTVIMCIYNEDLEVLKKALLSIQSQSYKLLEIIIIDDGASKDCKKFLNAQCKIDKRIKLIVNKKNIGLTLSLNKGLEIAKGEFIARMDGDDISLPKRIEKQVFFLNNNSDYDIVGTGVISFGKRISFFSPSFGLDKNQVNAKLFFTSCLCHPSVMIRKSFLDKNNLLYDSFFLKTQDYDLWERCSYKGNIAVIKDILLLYRIHENQISNHAKKEQINYSSIIMKRRVENLGICMDANQEKCHNTLKGIDMTNLYEVEKWVDILIQKNRQVHFVDKKSFEKELYIRLALVKTKLLIIEKNFLKIKLRLRDVFYISNYVLKLIHMKFKLLIFYCLILRTTIKNEKIY